MRKKILQRNVYLYSPIKLNLLFFWRKNATVSKTQRVCNVFYMIFGSSLGKVQLWQV